MTSAFARLPRDYRDMLVLLTREGCEFLVVGGWAVGAHGYVRATKDLDLFVRPTPDNAPRVIRALAAFGAPLHGLTADDFARPGIVLQVGSAMRIDVATTIDGVDFDGAARDKVTVDVDGVKVAVIGRDALIKNKRAAGREQDLVDVKHLERS